MINDFTVYKEEGKFAAWPAGYECKSWGNEILAGYFVGDYDDSGRRHHLHPENPFYAYFSRSYDNGKTWSHEKTDILAPSPAPAVKKPELLFNFEGRLDFTDPDLVLLFNMSGAKALDFSWWNFSTDRGKTWSKPYKLPEIEGFTFALNMRTAYYVLNKDEILLLCTCQKTTGREGNTFCAKMSEGGKKLEFLSWIGPEFPLYGYGIMPQIERRKDGTFVSLVRIQETLSKDLGSIIYYIGQYESKDEGQTWIFEGSPVRHHGGNPPALSVMKDGTWVLTYGYRRNPFGVRCKYSEDEGKTWSKEIILRDDAHTIDVGYPRSTALEDGSIFVCYYIGTYEGEEQHIEATIFDKEFLKTEK
jgi:hypothetical protein